MIERAPGVWQMRGIVPDVINAFVVETPEGDVLIDGGTRWTTGRYLRQLRGRKMHLVALTHVHPDHQGAAHEVCTRFKVPLACHEADAPAMEGKRRMGHNAITTLFDRLWSGPPHPVSVRWRGGEMFGDWQVIHTPGHTMGHVVFHRPRDGVVIVGDVVRNVSLRHGPGTLSETPHFFSVDPLLNRRSMKLVADLQPKMIFFGHGPFSTDGPGLRRLVESLG